MNRKLPKVYVNKIDKTVNNNEKIFYSGIKVKVKEKESSKVPPKEKNKSVRDKIDELLNSSNFVYKKNATIIFKNHTEINKDIVGQRDNKLITIDDEEYWIEEIQDLKF